MIDWLNNEVDPDIIRFVIIGGAIFLAVQLVYAIVRYPKLRIVGLSYLIFVVLYGIESISRWDQPWTWKLPLRAMAVVFGIIAVSLLKNLNSYERNSRNA